VITFLKNDLFFVLLPLLRFFGHGGHQITGGCYGSSMKSQAHLAQHIIIPRKNETKLYAYSYGSEKNKQKYGTETALEYELTNISIPITTISGGRDISCNFEAAQSFAKIVNDHNKSELVNCYKLDEWQHVSFVFIKDTKPLHDIIEKF